MHPTPNEVVYQIINSYKPYAVWAAIIAVVLLFIIAKVKKEVRIQQYQREDSEKEEARLRNERQRAKQARNNEQRNKRN